ncbi:MAG: AAA family ATPase [Deltaproteobacteria bacterium]|nr:AAA family ATPase [Deltaproteobacteria bacterium]
MSLTRIQCERFTAFEKIAVDLSPGINVFVGANGTGKTHLMKLAYAACDVSKTKLGFLEKLVRVFLPSGRRLGRLVKRQPGRNRGIAEVHQGDRKIRASFSTLATKPESGKVAGASEWATRPIESVYIPVKEMLASAPGFRSMYAQRELHFEEVYADILDRAYRPPLRGPADKSRRRLLDSLQEAMAGRVTVKEEEFFLSDPQGNLEFTLLAEGMRKLGLLWILIQNGTLLDGSVLFWDEPETNLNPRMFKALIEILLELQRQGVQVFLATHDYVILKEFDLQKKPADKIAYHSLFRDGGREIKWQGAGRYLDIHPNAIAETFADLYDREVKRTIGGGSR